MSGEEKFSAYIGGLGSGKTWAGISRGLKYSLQPKVGHHAPFGVIAAATYPALQDIIIPKLQEIMAITGLADWERDYAKSVKELTLINGSKVRLRSLDNANWMRGPEYTWFFIDEGRNVSLEAWKVLVARLRQKGYKRAGFVASTPNGFDWMYDVFHPEGDLHASNPSWARAKWYNAATFENVHLDEDYLTDLVGGYSGRFLRQEVYGEFVGIVEGGVFDQWDPTTGLVDDLAYDPTAPLYTFWDFGIGDPGICVFAQVKWQPEEVTIPTRGENMPSKTTTKLFPYLYILRAVEARDWTAAEWAAAYHTELQTTFRGARSRGDYGDPAGTQRNPSTGTSVISDLNAAGVRIVPVKKRPQDYAIRILNNMMAGNRVFVAREAKRVSDAFSSHKWHLKDGVRIGVNPVHDWTSHYVDAVRYGASVLLSFTPREETPAEGDGPEYEPNQWGYVFDTLDRPVGQRKLEFVPTIRVRS